MGNPTTYRPEYCEQLIEYMGRGLSLTAFAGSIGSSRQCLHNWQKAHPEFAEAVKIGQAKRTEKLEIQLLEAENGPKVQARIFALKNAAPDEWKDMKHSTLTGEDGGPVKIETRQAVELTDDELAAIAAGAK